jgi:tetratricopeptide (TPR) repeat protein
MPLLVRAAAIEERLGDRPALATVLNNLAALHYRKGAYRDAEPLLTRALSLGEQAGGPDDPSLAVTLDNYAAVLRGLSRGPEAEAAAHRAEAIRLAQSRRSR